MPRPLTEKETIVLSQALSATVRVIRSPREDAMEAEIERLRADRDCEKRLRKDSDDLATDLRLALEAVIANSTDTGLAHAVLQRIHGA